MVTELWTASAEGTLQSVVGKFLAKNPYLDRDEVLGECRIFALKSLSKYQGRCSLATWVYVCVNRWLLSMVRLHWWKHNMAKKAFLPLEKEPVVEESFSVERLLREVSLEAKGVIHLALCRDMKKKELRKTLSQLGWGREEIAIVWNEIKEALQ